MSGFTEIDYSESGGRKIGIGVIGRGFMGRVHSNAYVKIPYSFDESAAVPLLIAMCGRNEDVTKDVAARFGYKGYYTDWANLVKDPAIDIVDICTPDDMHVAPAITAAEAGKHVICEKPLAMTSEGAKTMVNAAEKAGVKHMLCHNYRFLPAVRFAKNLIDEGALGDIYQVRARYLQEIGYRPDSPIENVWYASGTKSGVMLGIGCHVVDMVRFLAGEIVSVTGMLKTFNGKRKNLADLDIPVTADEENAALVEFESGAVGTVESSGVSAGRKNQHTWEINGSKGSVAFDLEYPNHLDVCLDGGDPRTRGFTRVSATGFDYELHCPYLPPGHNAGWEYGHVYALNHFIDCVVNNKSVAPYGATFLDGYRIQVIMEKIKESARTGRKIFIRWD